MSAEVPNEEIDSLIDQLQPTEDNLVPKDGVLHFQSAAGVSFSESFNPLYEAVKANPQDKKGVMECYKLIARYGNDAYLQEIQPYLSRFLDKKPIDGGFSDEERLDYLQTTEKLFRNSIVGILRLEAKYRGNDYIEARYWRRSARDSYLRNYLPIQEKLNDFQVKIVPAQALAPK